ncbi:MAG: Bax inhibitor-1/YccA family protein [Bifidobacteriaceae bacterium]|jgi:uncharacterized YccA/Bax inhibitor family protein|nr:Bax inhibitor-1/YccA family protein [Bifidobacteriaceae bacterium]
MASQQTNTQGSSKSRMPFVSGGAYMSNSSFYQAKATITDTAVMTKKSVNRALDLSFGILIVFAFLGWIASPKMAINSNDMSVNSAVHGFSGMLLLAIILSLVLGLIAAFQTMPKPVLVLGYSAAEGFLVGTISKTYEMAYQGIVLTAILATIAVVAASFVIYRSGLIKVNQKFMKFLSISVLAYVILSVINLILVAIGSMSGAGIFSTSFGPLISLLAIILGALMLVSDLAVIDQGIQTGQNIQFSWKCAFGIMLSVIWIYFEILRLLALFNDRR